MRILLNGPEWNPWQVNFIIAIEIPMLLPAQVGIMGLDHGHGQQERTFGILSSMIEQESLGSKNHFIVVIHVHRARAYPGFGDHLHVVIPVQFGIGTVPFRMPGEVCGVNIRCQAFSKTMQLIRPDKMHLPGKTSPVSFCGEVMGKGWNLGRKLDCIVPRRNSARQASTHHHKTGRSAKRSIGVGCIKNHPLLSQPVDVWGFHQGMTIRSKELRSELIRLNQ